ncbi:hypothetical protein, partial [Nocardioides stalactiti]|uniref:hypothetical protein n=1 Tax=Nocardioides stalactiti TaxID=2755356 RepID=UPI0015FF07D5
MLRLTRAAVAGLALCAGLAGCVDDPPDEPDDDAGSPWSGASAPSSPSSPGQTEPDAAYPLADAQLRVGPPELVMGPSTSVDSPLNAITVDGIVRGYVGNVDSVLLEGTSAADLAPTDRVVVRRGDRPSDFDWCGAWLDAVVPDERDPDLLRAWYHAEDDCAYLANETHKSIAYAESRDGGLTFTKPRHPDNQVVTSPTGSAAGHHTGRGAPSVLRRGRFLWMYYLNVLPDLSTVTSVARAPVTSGGVPGSWRSWTGDGWTGDALGGPAAALDTTVPASSASAHAPTGEVVLVRQNAPSGGIVLQTSRDGLHFTPLPEPIVPYLDEQVRDDWSATDGDQIIGYVSGVGAGGA